MKNNKGFRGLGTLNTYYVSIVTTLILFTFSLPYSAMAQQADEIPNACSYLSAELASEILGQKVLPISGNEHYPTFYSQCRYKGTLRGGFKVGFVFKFMIKAMFDVEKLDPLQLDFSAAFAGGGNPHSEKLTSPGKLTYVFEGRKDSYLLILTGIDGPKNGAGQETVIVANYQLDNKNLSHAQRRDWMLAQASEQYQEWLQGR